jgi:hypothetical protein
MQLRGPWTSDDATASGQVFEFRLWALLTEQSRRLLHVFRMDAATLPSISDQERPAISSVAITVRWTSWSSGCRRSSSNKGGDASAKLRDRDSFLRG